MATTESGSTIGDLLNKIIDALVAVVDGFVTVLQQNAQTLAELTIVGGIIYGAFRLFGGAIGQLKGLFGMA